MIRVETIALAEPAMKQDLIESPSNTLHIYTRVSTAAQADKGTSLKSQLDIGKAKAKKLKFRWHHWDEGGRSSHHEDIQGRPKFFELYQAIKAGKVKHLWVYDQSRLSRNDQVASIFRYECNKQGVTLYTKDGQFNLSSPSDKLLKQMLDAVAEFENSVRAERSRLGKLAKVKRGYWQGGPPPFGYELVSGKLAESKSESKWVKFIFQQSQNGLSAAKIKKELDSNGVLARRGSLWSLGSIEALLRNTQYVGRYTYTDRIAEETVDVSCPKLVDDESWSAVNLARKRNASRKDQQNATTKNFYLLRDFMVCGHCGRKMAGRIKLSKHEQFYYCPNKERAWVKQGGSETPHQRKTGCGFERSMHIPTTDKIVFETVVALHRKSSILKEEVKRRVYAQHGIKQVKSADEIKDIHRKIERQQRELLRIQEAQGSLQANHLIGRTEDHVYKTAMRQLSEECDRISLEISNLQLSFKKEGEKRQWVDWVKMFGQELDEKRKFSDQEKQLYLKGLIEKIEAKFNPTTRDHELTLYFNHPLVGDGIRWRNKKDKSKGYEIIEGSSSIPIKVEKRDWRGK
jgi:DNA invertase Pin-like site-specific DNA recombinase